MIVFEYVHDIRYAYRPATGHMVRASPCVVVTEVYFPVIPLRRNVCVRMSEKNALSQGLVVLSLSAALHCEQIRCQLARVGMLW